MQSATNRHSSRIRRPAIAGRSTWNHRIEPSAGFAATASTAACPTFHVDHDARDAWRCGMSTCGRERRRLADDQLDRQQRKSIAMPRSPSVGRRALTPIMMRFSSGIRTGLEAAPRQWRMRSRAAYRLASAVVIPRGRCACRAPRRSGDLPAQSALQRLAAPAIPCSSSAVGGRNAEESRSPLWSNAASIGSARSRNDGLRRRPPSLAWPRQAPRTHLPRSTGTLDCAGSSLSHRRDHDRIRVIERHGNAQPISTVRSAANGPGRPDSGA